jgi:hypothetical protein
VWEYSGAAHVVNIFSDRYCDRRWKDDDAQVLSDLRRKYRKLPAIAIINDYGEPFVWWYLWKYLENFIEWLQTTMYERTIDSLRYFDYSRLSQSSSARLATVLAYGQTTDTKSYGLEDADESEEEVDEEEFSEAEDDDDAEDDFHVKAASALVTTSAGTAPPNEFSMHGEGLPASGPRPNLDISNIDGSSFSTADTSVAQTVPQNVSGQISVSTSDNAYHAVISTMNEKCQNSLVVVNTSMGIVTIKAMLDTGADYNFISLAQLRTLGMEHALNPDPKERVTIILADDKSTVTAEGFVMLHHAEYHPVDATTNYLNWNPEPSRFYVIKQLNRPFILGRHETVTKIIMGFLLGLPEEVSAPVFAYLSRGMPRVVDVASLNVMTVSMKKLSVEDRKAKDKADADAEKRKREEEKARLRRERAKKDAKRKGGS